MRAETGRLTVDEARLMPRFRAVFDRANTNGHQAHTLRTEIHRATKDGGQARPPQKIPAGGDTMSLRGVPVIGRGVTGAITGTKPGSRL